ncbi:CHAT domain-containing protein [Panacibacter ginsenosidivorans]|uniref:CHAT domain-containing protein n=1 Tax=Panacibacter ginsenosidivorans TaxID=1813871 RepID=A0A5B8VDW6_9BACT|nr:CHAT domain-containing protein [Panacibacter ginsenosidivorans]QEC69512.1 CHAT domain-containing protein [Panacibacter ginsenosidivorans]
MSINKIIIRGKEAAQPAGSNSRGVNFNIPVETSLEHIATYELSGTTRDDVPMHTIDLNDKLLEFRFDDGTTWMCDAATLHELYPEAENLQRDGGGFVIPATLNNVSTERGIIGTIVAKFISIFTKKAINKGIGGLAGKLEEKHLTEKKDDQIISREGLNFLKRDFSFQKVDEKSKFDTDRPFFLFIHGTNSDTKGAYGDLQEADVWNYIHDSYKENVLAFEHRTLTQSPLQNAVDLSKKLPGGAELHIISHSRGGLIGDILCRYSRDEKDRTTGFSGANIELLTKEKRDSDIECIKALNEIYSKKKIKVKKFIRVACPAAGTKLASKRMDQIFNVLYNLLGREANEIAVILKELIAETLQTKENIKVLPGIEAMGPESPFIKVLNDRAGDIEIDGSSLAIISGNGKLSLSFRGLFIILGKLFYMQRNDLVVNTDSMYLGAKRKDDVQYFFDEGKTVDHITYFKNNKTRDAILLALKTPDGKGIPGFTTKNQFDIPASDRGILPSIEHGALVTKDKIPTGEKPIAILLPGIMGSNLSLKDDKIWLAYLHTIKGGLRYLAYTSDSNITATSLIETSYGRLANNLSQTYEVIIYPFDWRKPLKECAADFNDTIIKLLKLRQPIKIIGHSMGGVLVRDFIIYHNETWLQLNASKDFRLLFLGSPLGGSYRIPAVLFGNDAIINSLNLLDRVHTKKELINIFVNFPGILSLLPLTTGTNEREENIDFADVATWEKMRDSLDDSAWPIPTKADLADFRDYREAINSKKEQIDYSNMVYIAGKDKYTPCDYFNDNLLPGRELVFLYTGEGDQSVTWKSGIPQKMIDAKAVYYVNATHGALANEPTIFPGILEILEKGHTSLLNKTQPSIRGEEKLFRMPDLYNFDLSERGIENAVFGITESNEQLVSQIPLSISVSHGDLAYATFPVLAGHFLNDGILYAEKVIDKAMNGTLTARHTLGIYPGAIGTSAALAGTTKESDFPGTIIVGLGEPGTLTAFLLSQTVEQAISKYLLDIKNQPDTDKEIGISALIIGCGYGGLTVESSIKAIIEGVNNANDKVAELYKNNIRTVQYIEFIELYEDKALNCMYALRKIESKENNNYNIRIGNKKFKILFGSKKRMPADFMEEWWRRFTIKSKTIKEGSNEISSLVFNVSTGDAREEEKELFSSTPLIDLFIEQISTQNSWTPCYAKTLFELMIPNDFKDQLKKKGSISWILEKETAAYPWELLQDNSTNAKPLCVNAGMIRQLSTKEYRSNINRVTNDKALIVADPILDGFITQLNGAKTEGELVDVVLEKNGYDKKTLINKNAAEIAEALFCNEYKIVHLAGHGLYNPDTPGKSGMVIGKEIFLTPFDIEQMETVPELVFINCCHLGKIEPGQEKFFSNKYKLAANLGTQLIQMGVKAVIAAGWAVNDDAAHEFAEAFYARMFSGCNFGDAVKEARAIIYERYHNTNNTWGAYQCYGDPFYRLINRTSSNTNTGKQYVMAEEVEIDLNNLKNDLDTKNYTCKGALDELKKIKEAKDIAEINDTDTSQIEAMIYYELGEYSKAVDAFTDLKDKEKATFTVAALEIYCNVRCKKYVEDFKAGGDIQALINKIDTVISELKMLLNIKSTAERNNLLGSSYKRKGLLQANVEDKKNSYKQAELFYYEAYKNNNDKKYAFKNWAALKWLLALSDEQKEDKQGLSYNEKLIQDWTKELEQNKTALKQLYLNMDYWELIEDATIDLTFLLIDPDKAKDDANWKKLENKYKNIWKKQGSRGKKKAEIETLEILADVAALSTNDQGVLLKNKLAELKENLEIEIADQ